MSRRTKRIFLFLLILAVFLPTSQALANVPRVNYCLTDGDLRCLTLFDGLGAFLSEWGTTLAVSIIGAISMIIWTLDRLALLVYAMAVHGTWLEIFREDLIGNLSTLMPDTLRQIALGSTGIMYIALSLAGVLMTLPLITSGTGRLVKPDRVIIWGVTLTALFVSGTAGYDLIGAIEDLRVSVVRQMMGAEDTTDAVQDLVLIPMRATEGEATLDLGNLTQLPSQFLDTYFPDIQKEEVSVKLIESGAIGVINTEVETLNSKLARITGASRSLLYAILSLLSAVVILGFSLAFVFLGVAALILILFLVAALPMGFFEFGNVILIKIVERYVQIAAISLALALFMRISGGLMGALPGVDTPSAMVEWLLLIGSLFMANQILWGAARRLLTSSFSSFSDAIRTGIGVPTDPPPMIGQRIGQAATGILMGALAGGQAGAVVGGLSGLIGGPMMIPSSKVGNGLGDSMGAGGEPTQRGNAFIQNGTVTLPQNPVASPATSTPLDVYQPIPAQSRSHLSPTATTGLSALPTPSMPIADPALIGTVPRPVAEPQKQNIGMPKINRAAQSPPNPPISVTPTHTQTSRAVAASKALSPDEK